MAGGEIVPGGLRDLGGGRRRPGLLVRLRRVMWRLARKYPLLTLLAVASIATLLWLARFNRDLSPRGLMVGFLFLKMESSGVACLAKVRRDRGKSRESFFFFFFFFFFCFPLFALDELAILRTADTPRSGVIARDTATDWGAVTRRRSAGEAVADGGDGGEGRRIAAEEMFLPRIAATSAVAAAAVIPTTAADTPARWRW